MRVLFIHPSFPGPFHSLAASLGAVRGNTVLFLSERTRREVRLHGVRRLLVAGSPPDSETSAWKEQNIAEKEMTAMLKRGANMAKALLKLKTENFVPDIICASSGFGANLYVRDIFPKAFYCVYADWFYTKGVNHTFFNQGKNRSPADFAPARIRNLSQLNALAESDLSITSTLWQKKQYPSCVASSIHVLHEGVDTDFFSPGTDPFVVNDCNLSKVRELVTFSGRNLDPFRGFRQLCQVLPRLLTERPQCHAAIMASCGANLPPDLEALLTTKLRDRIHFLGFRPYNEYRMLLRASTVHMYLTAPFALSAGLFEAMSCGCVVLGSNTEPVREVITPGQNGFLCDFWDTDALAQTLATLLQQASLMQPVRDAARHSILWHYDLQTLAPQHLQLLLNAFEAHRQ